MRHRSCTAQTASASIKPDRRERRPSREAPHINKAEGSQMRKHPIVQQGAMHVPHSAKHRAQDPPAVQRALPAIEPSAAAAALARGPRLARSSRQHHVCDADLPACNASARARCRRCRADSPQQHIASGRAEVARLLEHRLTHSWTTDSVNATWRQLRYRSAAGCLRRTPQGRQGGCRW